MDVCCRTLTLKPTLVLRDRYNIPVILINILFLPTVTISSRDIMKTSLRYRDVMAGR